MVDALLSVMHLFQFKGIVKYVNYSLSYVSARQDCFYLNTNVSDTSDAALDCQ